MSLIAELTLHEDIVLFEPTFERAENAECVFEDVHYLQDDGTSYVFFWWASGCDLDRFEAALDADSTVEGFRQVAEIDGRSLYRIVTRSFPPEQPLVFPAYRKNDITELESRRNADGLHLRARFPDREALDRFIEAGADIARNIEINCLYEETSPPEHGGSLTPKQEAALTLAHEAGYFETPSKVTLGELATDLDVTAQTLSGHIRAGIEKLVADAVEDGHHDTDVFKDVSG